MSQLKYQIKKELNLFHRKWVDLTNKEINKWIKRFFEVIFIIEDEFCDFVDILEENILLDKMKMYYNEYYKKKYKEKNLHIVTCPKKIYNDFAYALSYGEYYTKIITEIKHIKITTE